MMIVMNSSDIFNLFQLQINPCSTHGKTRLWTWLRAKRPRSTWPPSPTPLRSTTSGPARTGPSCQRHLVLGVMTAVKWRVWTVPGTRDWTGSTRRTASWSWNPCKGLTREFTPSKPPMKRGLAKPGSGSMSNTHQGKPTMITYAYLSFLIVQGFMLCWFWGPIYHFRLWLFSVQCPGLNVFHFWEQPKNITVIAKKVFKPWKRAISLISHDYFRTSWWTLWRNGEFK